VFKPVIGPEKIQIQAYFKSVILGQLGMDVIQFFFF